MLATYESVSHLEGAQYWNLKLLISMEFYSSIMLTSYVFISYDETETHGLVDNNLLFSLSDVVTKMTNKWCDKVKR